MAHNSGEIFWFNQRWNDYTGSSSDSMQSFGWKGLLHPEQASSVLNFLKEAWQKSEPWELTFLIKSKEGDYRWFLTRVYPIKNDGGDDGLR